MAKHCRRYISPIYCSNYFYKSPDLPFRVLVFKKIIRSVTVTDLLIANVVPKQFPKGNFIRGGATSDIKECITSKDKTMKRSFVLVRNMDAVIRNMIAANQWNNTSYEVTLNQSVTHLLNDPYLTPDIDLLEIKDLFNKHLLKIISNPDIWIKRMNEYYTCLLYTSSVSCLPLRSRKTVSPQSGSLHLATLL